MKKSKQPVPKKSVDSRDEQEDVLARSLCEFALDLDARKGGASAMKTKNDEFQKLVRKCLYQKKDEALYEALELAQEADSSACALLKDSIEEASEVIVFKRDDGHDLEVNAFVVPLFAHTSSGLHADQCFQDEEAFDLLRKSFQEAQLESRDASVVLVAHAYHLDEMDRIRYSRLNEMVREAFDSMTRKKAGAAPAIASSMSGWPENHFSPEEQVVELRFLLGFALKRLDDPFYRVPKDEAAADRYFEARAMRFQQWAQQVAPLVKRCLVADGSDIDIDFLYQDLFHGGKERGIAEHYMLQMMAELHHDLRAHGTLPENTRAIIGPIEMGGEMALRVNLYAETDGTLLASADKPISIARDLGMEADDTCDALTTIGVKSLALAARFDADGQAVDVRPYEQ
jgi:hypothetical protein